MPSTAFRSSGEIVPMEKDMPIPHRKEVSMSMCQQTAKCSFQEGGSCLGRIQLKMTENPLWMTDPLLLWFREKFAAMQRLSDGMPVSLCILPCNHCETPSPVKPQTQDTAETNDSISYRVEQHVTRYRTYPKGNSYPVCPRCGADIDREYMSFCDQCGQRLSWARFPDW